MWDDDFSKKKFQLGRVIERDQSEMLNKGISKLSLNDQSESLYKGRVIRTTNIDTFLCCDEEIKN